MTMTKPTPAELTQIVATLSLDGYPDAARAIRALAWLCTAQERELNRLTVELDRVAKLAGLAGWPATP